MEAIAARDAARSKYIREGKTIAQVAAETAVSPRTIARWSREGCWAELRGARRKAGAARAVEILRRQVELIAAETGVFGPAEKDQIEKLAKATNALTALESRLEPDPTTQLRAFDPFAKFCVRTLNDSALATVREALARYCDYARRNSPQ